MSEHREILEALVSRNPDAADGTMRRHIRAPEQLSAMAEPEQVAAELAQPRTQPRARAEV